MDAWKWNTVAFTGALGAAALLFTACDTVSGAGSTADTGVELKVLAAKVRYLNPPDAQKTENRQSQGGGFDKRAAKRSAPGAMPKRADAACELDGQFIDEGTDTTAYGGTETYQDTSRSYTAAGKLICAMEDVTVYSTQSSHTLDSTMESWMATRLDFATDTGSDWILKMSGSGKVTYLSGYTMSLESISVILGYSGVTEFKMTLGLEGGFTVPLALAPSATMDGQTGPAPTDVVLSGPILKDGTQVGTFEVLGNDSVVIRDAGQAIVPVPG